jgi:hypothetical protein
LGVLFPLTLFPAIEFNGCQ